LRGPVGDRKIEAQIGFCPSVAFHRFTPGQPGERPLDLVAGFVPERDGGTVSTNRLRPPADERRLDVDLRELWLAIEPQVLVPEAACDLEIAIEPDTISSCL